MSEAATSGLTRESPAKVNLTLRVVGRRPDGFHEIESLVARITLSDTVSVAPRDDGRWTLACDQPGIPCDERNFALQAVARLSDAVGRRDGVHISIRKRIPAGAGLGGGSSNAATVLMLLNELWQLGLSRAELSRVGVAVGSDVPLFLGASVCVIRGRGERVEDVLAALQTRLVLFLPELHSATAAVYAGWDRLDRHPARPALPEITAQLHSASKLTKLLFNDLEDPAFAANPDLAALAAHLRGACPLPVHMTGSGAAFFTVVEGTPDAAGLAQAAASRSPIPVKIVLAEIAC